MTSEGGCWITVRRSLSPFGKLKRLENRCDLGTPDTLYCLRRQRPNTKHGVSVFQVAEGLMELKEDVWPHLERTPLTIKSLTLDQVLWHEEWEEAGGKVVTLARIGRDWLWLDSRTLRAIFQKRMRRMDLAQFILGSGAFPTTAVLKKIFGVTE